MREEPQAILLDALADVHTVAISGHLNPDGDCVGSCMALYHYLLSNFDVAVDVYLEDIPEVFKFIAGTEHILHEDGNKSYDLFIVLDCGDVDRLGFAKSIFQRSQRTLCVDHHIQRAAFGDYSYVCEGASSTAELVFNMIDKSLLQADIATCLYIGIIHDTGVFRYSNVAPSTHRAAACLLEQGIEGYVLADQTFYEKTNNQNHVLGRMLSESKLSLDGRMISAILTREEMEEIGVISKDLDGIVSQLRNTKGVQVALFLYETSEGVFKGSLRGSLDVDVNQIALSFLGGGHKKAAGFSSTLPPETIIMQVQQLLLKQL